MGNDEILKAELEKTVAECARLREENARLRLRVREAPDTLAPTPKQFTTHNNKEGQASAAVTADSPPELKVSLFASLFRGREDVYATRWKEEAVELAIRLRVFANGPGSHRGWQPCVAGKRDLNHEGRVDSERVLPFRR